MANTIASAGSSENKSEALHPALPQGTDSGPGAPISADRSLDIVRILNRTLRGRYRLTLALCLLTGAIGAGTGWYWAGPLYRSDGMVRISSVLPAVIQPGDQNQPIPMFDSFMEAQQELVTSRALLEKALQDPIWDGKGIARPSVATLAENLKVVVRARSENLRVSYSDPVAAVACSAVSSTITAYQNVFVSENQKLDRQRLQSLEEYRNTLVNQPAAPDAVANNAALTPTAETPSSSEFQMPSAAKVAMSDPAMARLIDRRDDIGDQLKQASTGYGPTHPYVSRLTEAYKIAAERVDQHLSDYLALQADIENTTAGPATAAAGGVTLPTANTPIQQSQPELDRVNRRIDELKAEAAMPKRFEIVDIGDLPVHVPARQIKWSVMGGGIGGGLVLGIMVFAGSRHRRYRVYADMIDNIGKKLRFTGAVPNLDAASKRRHSADAAQCMHYFRHKLAQNGNVFMITSADWGEGRTSVVMSLGLSLCGAGARTLVIDADLATRGLTHALGLDNRPGFFEMLRDGEPIAPLKMPSNGIAILPTGAVSEADGFSISAPAVGRLLARLKAEFDVILIDSGPVLWRVETCVIARQVDGVLLTIGCGQQQSSWDKALEELESAGAVCGAVFNRAEPHDFHRSMQRHAGPQTNAQRRPIAGPLANLGPLVQAVAMSLTHDVEFFPVRSAAVAAKKVA